MVEDYKLGDAGYIISSSSSLRGIPGWLSQEDLQTGQLRITAFFEAVYPKDPST